MNRKSGLLIASLVLISTSTMSVNSMEVPARAIVTELDYRGMSLQALMNAYKKAYTVNNFRVRATFEKQSPGKDRWARLTMELNDPKHPTRKSRGALTIRFHSPEHERCTPCGVVREMMDLGDSNEYTEEGWLEFQQRFFKADAGAQERVKLALGKSV